MGYAIIFLVLSCSLSILAEDVVLTDLEPDQAAQYINQQDQTLKYAPKIESNVPRLRYIGNRPEEIVEDIYLANQYHGQDGLGAYVYGYSVPDITKTEKKDRSGDLKGAYNYINGNGQEIKVQYWDDGTGFHQIDNVANNQPEDDPEVKAAKEEHLRIWHEQALRNSQAPKDPHSNEYNNEGQDGSLYQQSGIVEGLRYGQSQSNLNSVEYNGQYSNNQQAYAQGPGGSQHGSNQQSGKQTQEDEEENGPPKGFFYAFNYPVGIDVAQQAKQLEAAYTQNKDLYEQQLKGQAPSLAGSSSSYHAAV